MTDGDSYYRAGGKRIPLLATSDLAIDLSQAAKLGLSEKDVEHIRGHGQELTIKSLVLVAKDDLPASFKDKAELSTGVHPVYRTRDGSLIVALPEIRVEAEHPAELAKVNEIASLTDNPAKVTRQSTDRLLLQPKSGRGADALILANRLGEELNLDLAQARFLRIVRRPRSP